MQTQAELVGFDEDFLPEDCLFLLGEEDNNISSFRENIEKEKARLSSDFDYMMKDLLNLFEETKVKMIESLDSHYKNYISKYGYFKEILMEFKNMKMDLPLKNVHPAFAMDLSNVSNCNLIRELEELRYQSQMSKMFNYVSAMQKEKLTQIVSSSRELLQLSTQLPNYYNSEAFTGLLKEIKSVISQLFVQKMQNLNNFVKSVNPQEQIDNNVFNQFKLNMSDFNKNPAQTIQNTNLYSNILPEKDRNPSFASPFPLNAQTWTPQPTNFMFPPNNQNQSANIQSMGNWPITTPNNQIKTVQKDIKSEIPKSKFQFLNNNITLSSDRQNCKGLPMTQNLFLDYVTTVKTDHDDILLCLIAITNDIIAVGSKDCSISLWKISSQSKINILEGHQGSICSLSMMKTINSSYLISGSDHEDGSILLWDVQKALNGVSNPIVSKLIGHNAAVVALLSLNDGQTVISGSYDKEILIWNINTGKSIQKLTGHTSSITSLWLTKDKTRFASASLDNSVNIWKINYKDSQGQQSFDSCYLERGIKNNCFVCSLNCLQDSKILLTGGKDGKIKLWNLETGEIERTLTANLGPIVEIMIFEGNNNNDQFKDNKNWLKDLMVVTSSSKDQNLILTNVGNGNNELIDVGGKVFIEFGCGVNPKMQFVKNENGTQIIIVNQGEREKLFSVWNVRFE